MFYRAVLAKENHPEFPVNQGKDESAWLSKDLDFTHIAREDIPQDTSLPCGLVQSGIRLSALDFAETVRTGVLEFDDGLQIHLLVADPLELYREKEACLARLNRPQDRLHLELLKTYLKYELWLARQSKDPGLKIALEARYQNYARELLH